MELGVPQYSQSSDPTLVAAANSSAHAGEVDVLDLMIAIARRKKFIVAVTIIVTALAAVVALLLPNYYTATTSILPPQQNQSMAASLLGQAPGLGMLAALGGSSLGLKNPNDMYVAMLKSRTAEDALIEEFHLRELYRDDLLSEARRDLEKRSDISTGKDGLIIISVDDRDPQRAAALANAYVKRLENLNQRLAVTEASRRRLFFEQQMTQSKEQLTRAEQALKQMQQRTGLLQLDGQAKVIIEAVAAVRAQIAAKEVQLQAASAFGTAQNPSVIRMQEELAGLRSQRVKLERQNQSGNGDLQVPTAQLPEVGQEYVRSLRDMKYAETVFELLAKQYEIAKLDEAKDSALIQVVDPATVPDKKSSPKRALIIGIAAILGLVTGILCALLAEVRQHMGKDPQQSARMQLLSQLTLGSNGSART